VERLPAHLEAGAIIRRVETEGGFAAVLRKGDPDRGALVLIIRHRGQFRALLERALDADFRYSWRLASSDESIGSEQVQRLVENRTRLDADLWLIELDVAQPERFIAETISST
jgi:hypothetical protein